MSETRENLTLQQLELLFQRDLLGLEDPSAILPYIKATPQCDALTRQLIYRDGYCVRLCEILTKYYPKLYAFCGEDEFLDLAERYVDAHPAQHFSIRLYGAEWPAFLALEFGDTDPRVALAKLEWAIQACMEAPDAVPLTVADLIAIPGEAWPEQVFTTHPSLHQFISHYDVVQWWQQLAVEPTMKISPTRALAARICAVWREGATNSHFEWLEPAAGRVLTAVLAQQNFAEICELLCADMAEEDVAGYAIGLIRRWTERGLFLL